MNNALDITTMTVTELESLAYRVTQDRDVAVRNLQIVEAEIVTRKQQENSKDQNKTLAKEKKRTK